MDIWYSTLKGIARIYSTFVIDGIHVSGLEQIPEGPKIIAANHPNTTNALLLPLIFPDRQYFMISSQAFLFPLWGWFLKRCRHIPVAPGDGKKALSTAAEKITQGDSVVILPEGQTPPPGQNRKGGTGAIRLALSTRAPIVPVGFYIPRASVKTLRITGKRGSGEGYFQIGGQCSIQVGPPWFPATELTGELNGAAIRALTDRLMDYIRALAAQAAAGRPA